MILNYYRKQYTVRIKWKHENCPLNLIWKIKASAFKDWQVLFSLISCNFCGQNYQQMNNKGLFHRPELIMLLSYGQKMQSIQKATVELTECYHQTIYRCWTVRHFFFCVSTIVISFQIDFFFKQFFLLVSFFVVFFCLFFNNFDLFIMIFFFSTWINN